MNLWEIKKVHNYAGDFYEAANKNRCKACRSEREAKEFIQRMQKEEYFDDALTHLHKILDDVEFKQNVGQVDNDTLFGEEGLYQKFGGSKSNVITQAELDLRELIAYASDLRAALAAYRTKYLEGDK